MSRRPSDDPLSEEEGGLFDAALENLVRQFAQPLDCLRELVQNSIDAGSPRVEVRLRWTPPEEGASMGLLAITVEDFGQGMDEQVIDNELTRMFASSKTHDLSKIGRFGVGFTSIFAIEPQLVHLRTGRHGAGWELFFHPDRSFDKLRLSEPVQGTCIVLYKPVAPDQRQQWTRDIRSSLRFWCEHCSIPVLFDDGEAASAPPDSPAAADPFAAFAEPVAARAEVIPRPLDMPDTPWAVRHERDGIIVWAGLGDSPKFSWYNGGLTLLSTRDPSCLSTGEPAVHHLCLKVQHHRLEHTLTRDNVVQDAEWARAMGVVREAARKLAEHIVSAHEDCLTAAEPLEPTLEVLARWRKSADELPPARALRQRLHLPQVDGPPRPLPPRSALGDLSREGTRWMVSKTSSALTRALSARGVGVYQDSAAARVLLELAPEDEGSHRWVLVEAADASEELEHLFDAVRALQQRTSGARPAIEPCRLHSAGDGSALPLVVHRRPSAEPIHRDGLGPGLWQRLWGSPSTVWVNVDHPNVQLAAQVARVSPDIGAYALLQAVFLTDPAVGGHAAAWRALQQTLTP